MAMLYRPNDPNRPRRNPLMSQIPISSPLGQGPAGASSAMTQAGSIAAKAARAGVSVQVMGDLLDKVAKGTITLGDMDALAGVQPVRLPPELGGIQVAEPNPITSAVGWAQLAGRGVADPIEDTIADANGQ